jgi:hypothetical protein
LARAELHPAELNPSDAVALATFYEVLVRPPELLRK